jgi:hypothetical protein
MADAENLWRGFLKISGRGQEEGSHCLGRPQDGLFRAFDHEPGGGWIEVEFQVHRGLESFSVGRSIEGSSLFGGLRSSAFGLYRSDV